MTWVDVLAVGADSAAVAQELWDGALMAGGERGGVLGHTDQDTPACRSPRFPPLRASNWGLRCRWHRLLLTGARP